MIVYGIGKFGAGALTILNKTPTPVPSKKTLGFFSLTFRHKFLVSRKFSRATLNEVPGQI